MSTVEKINCECVCKCDESGKCICECEIADCQPGKEKVVEVSCSCKCDNGETCVAKFTIRCDCDPSTCCEGTGCGEKDVFTCTTQCGSCTCEFRLKKPKNCQVVKCECTGSKQGGCGSGEGAGGCCKKDAGGCCK